MKRSLKAEFAFVRNTFFPRWKAGKEWHIVPRNRADYTKESGFCDLDAHTILIDPLMAGQDGANRTALLIHEVCHAVAERGHGKRFLRRLHQAADRARRLGLNQLAGILEQEVLDYQKEGWELRAGDVYDCVERAVLDSKGMATYSNVIHFIAGDYGLLVGELETRFRRLRKVYEKAQKKFKTVI